MVNSTYIESIDGWIKGIIKVFHSNLVIDSKLGKNKRYFPLCFMDISYLLSKNISTDGSYNIFHPSKKHTTLLVLSVSIISTAISMEVFFFLQNCIIPTSLEEKNNKIFFLCCFKQEGGGELI